MSDYKPSILGAPVVEALQKLDADRTLAWETYEREDRAHKETKARAERAEADLTLARAHLAEMRTLRADLVDAEKRADAAEAALYRRERLSAEAQQSGLCAASCGEVVRPPVPESLRRALDTAGPSEPGRCRTPSCGGAPESTGYCQECGNARAADEAEARKEAERGEP